LLNVHRIIPKFADAIVLVSKFGAVWFLIVNLLGTVWFLGSLSAQTVLYSLVTSVTLLYFLLLVRGSSQKFRRGLAVFAAVSIVLSFVEMRGDWTLIGGTDWGAIYIRLLECALYGVMFLPLASPVMRKPAS
jgi:hypothetical protein